MTRYPAALVRWWLKLSIIGPRMGRAKTPALAVATFDSPMNRPASALGMRSVINAQSTERKIPSEIPTIVPNARTSGMDGASTRSPAPRAPMTHAAAMNRFLPKRSAANPPTKEAIAAQTTTADSNADEVIDAWASVRWKVSCRKYSAYVEIPTGAIKKKRRDVINQAKSRWRRRSTAKLRRIVFAAGRSSRLVVMTSWTPTITMAPQMAATATVEKIASGSAWLRMAPTTTKPTMVPSN